MVWRKTAVVMVGLVIVVVSCSTPEKTKTIETTRVDSGVTVTASAFENKAAGGWGDFPPEKTIDQDLDKMSSWRAEVHEKEKGQWIKYDIGTARELTHVKVAFLSGSQRYYDFKISLSTDDKAYQQVFTGKNSGTTDSLEVFDFVDTKARYVMLTGFGNANVDTTKENKYANWFNIVETEIYYK